MKTPPYDDAFKCLRYRKDSKSGSSYNEEGHKFCAKIFEKYPEWYRSTEEQVIKETLPFGARQSSRDSE